MEETGETKRGTKRDGRHNGRALCSTRQKHVGVHQTSAWLEEKLPIQETAEDRIWTNKKAKKGTEKEKIDRQLERDRYMTRVMKETWFRTGQKASIIAITDSELSYNILTGKEASQAMKDVVARIYQTLQVTGHGKTTLGATEWIRWVPRRWNQHSRQTGGLGTQERTHEGMGVERGAKRETLAYDHRRRSEPRGSDGGTGSDDMDR